MPYTRTGGGCVRIVWLALQRRVFVITVEMLARAAQQFGHASSNEFWTLNPGYAKEER